MESLLLAEQPHNAEAENRVVGSILVNPDAYYDAADILESASFFLAPTRVVWDAITSLFNQNKGINAVTVAHYLTERHGEQFYNFGGEEFIQSLVAVGDTANCRAFAELVAQCHMQRRLLSVGQNIPALLDGEHSAEQATVAVMEELLALSGQSSAGHTHKLRVYLDRIWELAYQAELRTIPTRFTYLDMAMNGGFQPGQLALIAGRPGDGKSTLATNIAIDAAKMGYTSLMHTMEMGGVETAIRALANEASVNNQNVLAHLGEGTNQRDQQRVVDSIGSLSDLPVWINERSAQTVEDITIDVKRHKLHSRLDMVVVDHVQLVRAAHTRVSGNRNTELDDISMGLKNLARDEDIVVLACAQLNRDVARGNREPELTDLRDSGTLEQNSDIVIMLHEPQDNQGSELSPQVLALLKKNRSGEETRQELRFNKTMSRFVEWENS